MMKNKVRDFRKERDRLNTIVMKYSGINTKRFHNIDHQAYRDGALPAKIKELLGLTASLVLRCDDCIMYHLIRCYEEKVSDAELEETVAIGLIAGGSITIPHIRRVWEAWENMKNQTRPAGKGTAKK
jgi:AhpD family alkylhydroperoxidase